MTHSLRTKGIKISIPIDLSDFPVGAIPPPGTVGAKAMTLDVQVQTPAGVSLTATLKCSALQKLLPPINAAPQGGFVVMQGKLGPGNTMIDVGCIFQPNKVMQPADEAGQMQILG